MANYIEGTQVLTNEQDIVCAWHNPVGTDPDGSHGVCEACAHDAYKRWQLGKVPSYVGERQAFIEYKENKRRK